MDQLLEGAILSTSDVVGLYLNILHEEGLTSLRKLLDARMEKKLASETLLELSEFVLNNRIFHFKEKTLIELRATAIGTKFAPPHAIIFRTDLEENIF